MSPNSAACKLTKTIDRQAKLHIVAARPDCLRRRSLRRQDVFGPRADMCGAQAHVCFAGHEQTADSLFIEELANCFHRLVRLLFHDPMP